MTTTLQAWGNSQGVRLPKALLAALSLETGARLDVELSPKKDAIIVKPATPLSRVRARHRIEDLVAAMPKNYRTTEFSPEPSGREVW
jgi:antitoxin component of MazEF toxin-antitoxin module